MGPSILIGTDLAAFPFTGLSSCDASRATSERSSFCASMAASMRSLRSRASMGSASLTGGLEACGGTSLSRATISIIGLNSPWMNSAVSSNSTLTSSISLSATPISRQSFKVRITTFPSTVLAKTCFGVDASSSRRVRPDAFASSAMIHFSNPSLIFSPALLMREYVFQFTTSQRAILSSWPTAARPSSQSWLHRRRGCSATIRGPADLPAGSTSLRKTLKMVSLRSMGLYCVMNSPHCSALPKRLPRFADAFEGERGEDLVKYVANSMTSVPPCDVLAPTPQNLLMPSNCSPSGSAWSL
mmetsp:Transcript_30540/g.90614  ORF Transcript_30540/g.90614 Transcript_30540/m.90614 type:complete len:300 (-) Transcript_30540:1043-1942(-)